LHLDNSTNKRQSLIRSQKQFLIIESRNGDENKKLSWCRQRARRV